MGLINDARILSYPLKPGFYYIELKLQNNKWESITTRRQQEIPKGYSSLDALIQRLKIIGVLKFSVCLDSTEPVKKNVIHSQKVPDFKLVN